MTKMTPELKAKLAAYTKAKRAANPKPKDYDLNHWTVACDAALESSARDIGTEDGLACYLRYVPAGAVEVLARWLPTRKVNVRAYNGDGFRPVLAFHHYHAVAVMRFLGLDENKYVRRFRSLKM